MMNARQMGMALVVAGSLALGVSAVAAQGGSGRGPGPGTGDCPTGQTCTQTQVQAGNGFGVGTENCPMGGDCAQQQTQTQAGNSNGQGGRWANNNSTTNAGQGGRFAVQSGPMTDDVAAAMTAGWLDEVQAEAAYTQLIAQFGEVVPFVALQQAEAQHA
ncbi:MAG TPA: hypothetical protein VER79_05565, partial [Candidatus Limnocylindrales bacterium]|nr:hypothetical protein [Candidatus Limnocylindrales bacterium]